MQSIPPHSSYVISLLILSSLLRLGLSSVLFPSGFETKTLYAFIIVSMHATRRGNILLGLINFVLFGEEYRSYLLIHIDVV